MAAVRDDTFVPTLPEQYADEKRSSASDIERAAVEPAKVETFDDQDVCVFPPSGSSPRR